jgi:hypothetical protein
MNNAPAILRSLIVYAVCVPLAVFVGYLLADQWDRPTYVIMGMMGLLLVFPLLLKWHHPALVMSWNTGIVVFFLNGQPSIWMVMVALSLGISVLERALNSRKHFISVPEVTWPLLMLAAVAVFTAQLNGGFGLRSFGGDVYGGKKYVYLFVGIASYFALTARPIPRERAWLYVGLFFLAETTKAIGDFYSIAPAWMNYLFYIFPPTQLPENFELGVTRLGGVGQAGMAVYLWLMARYGIRGVFLEGKLWRPVLMALCVALIFLGGFRTTLFLAVLMFVVIFFMEGLHRTWLMPIFVMVGLLAVVAIIPLADKLPFTFQRTLAFMPFLQLDTDAKLSADSSTNWRFQMWSALLPQVPKHLLLGKGYAISPEEFNEMMGDTALANGEASKVDASQGSLSLSNDYHNGMLSIVLAFGIWGVLVFLWFAFVALRVMFFNFKHGDPALRTVNSVLFVLFLYETLSYLSCLAGLQIATDIPYFIGYLGLSIALNHGVIRPARGPDAVKPAFYRAGSLPRPRPAFQR